MTDVVAAFRLNIPAKGSPNNVFFVDCELGTSNVTSIILRFPPGPSGLVGVRIEHGGTQVYPIAKGTWFILDDYTLEIRVSRQGNAGQWHVAGYNSDIYPHTIDAYFFYDYVDYQPGSDSSLPVSL